MASQKQVFRLVRQITGAFGGEGDILPLDHTRNVKNFVEILTLLKRLFSKGKDYVSQ